MPQFRKKPVVIEAVLAGDVIASPADEWAGFPEWLQDAYDAGVISFKPGQVTIRTLEGEMTGGSEDWIIRGVKGELYPCRADIFEATYEAVD
jgi:hypothetical protein